MIIHIRNFGKIKTADIDLGQLVILVGENNSGKTYLMQLIYGLFSFLRGNEFAKYLNEYIELDLCDNTIIEKDNIDFYTQFNNYINEIINDNKEKIVTDTFHSDELTVGKISVEFEPSQAVYAIEYEGEIKQNGDSIRQYSIHKDEMAIRKIGFVVSVDKHFIEGILRGELLSLLLSDIIGIRVSKYLSRKDSKSYIYFPASRSGMVLLYANYLADTNNKSNYENELVEIDDYGDEDAVSENEYGLTEPVYDFLQFLLKYKNGMSLTERNKDLIDFIDKNIIDGRFEKVGNTMRYMPASSSQSIPIYLSSSLATELAPVYQILSGVNYYKTIFYDEIETCQHPTKQLQLARLLVRMVNHDFRIVVSTHSDTMAAAINNLIILSNKSNKEELARKLGYEDADILKSTNVKAYHFDVEDGETIVKEIDGLFRAGIGFDFDIFNLSNEKIYQDAVALAGEVND